MKVPRSGNLTMEELKQNMKKCHDDLAKQNADQLYRLTVLRCEEEIIRVKQQKLLEDKRELLKLKKEKSEEWSVPEWVEEDERNRKAKREKKTKKKVIKKKENQVKNKNSLDSSILTKPKPKSPEKTSKSSFSLHETKFTGVSAEKASLKEEKDENQRQSTPSTLPTSSRIEYILRKTEFFESIAKNL